MIKLKVFNGLLGVAAAMLASLALIFVWANYIEKPYLSYENLPFQVMTKPKAGEVVELLVERCNSSKKAQSYNTSRAVLNLKTKEVITLADARVSIESGCHRGVSRLNKLPEKLPAGLYKISGVALVPGSVIRFEVPWYSEPFEIE